MPKTCNSNKSIDSSMHSDGLKRKCRDGFLLKGNTLMRLEIHAETVPQHLKPRVKLWWTLETRRFNLMSTTVSSKTANSVETTGNK